MGYELVKVTTENDWRAYHSLRRHVLWEARGRNGYDEKRPAEYAAANHPLLLKLGGRPIGTTRLDDLGDGRGVVRLVAIAADVQRRGHGRALSVLVEDYARALGMKTLLVNADPEAVGYYEKIGWTACTWDVAELTGIAADCKQIDQASVLEVLDTGEKVDSHKSLAGGVFHQYPTFLNKGESRSPPSMHLRILFF
jgi:N-acetylglutamate synthase-like GNAT family acetyltransferase